MLRACRRLLVIVLALAGAACAGADPRPPSDNEARAGRLYAQQNCASCHAVARGQIASPVASAPAFQSVADTPGMTALALHVWLRTPHQTMPNLIVPDAAIDDLSAYLISLKQER